MNFFILVNYYELGILNKVKDLLPRRSEILRLRPQDDKHNGFATFGKFALAMIQVQCRHHELDTPAGSSG